MPIFSDKKLSNAPAIMNDEIHILILYCYDAERMACYLNAVVL